MTALVVDSSLILASQFRDERTAAVLAVLDRVATEGAVVPTLWWFEVANVLLLAERRGRVPREERLAALADLAVLPVETDASSSWQAWSETLILAETHRLTVYDAAYLELALRRDLPLATLDRELRTAATRAGAAAVLP